MYCGKSVKLEKKIWLSSPTMHGEELIYMKEAFDTNWMSTVGKNINEVERLVAKKIGCKYAVALSAGTAFKMTPNQQESIIQTIRNCFA